MTWSGSWKISASMRKMTCHLPDAELMFFDRLLAFDHLRHQIHIVAAADVAARAPRKAYDRALRDIAALEQKLARGLQPRSVAQAGESEERAS